MVAVPYITYGGASLPPPPYQFNQTRFLAHVFCADQVAQQSFVDRTLNAASTPGRYRVLSRFVLLLAVASAEIGPTLAPYANQGTTSETDVGFWISLLDTETLTVMVQPAYVFVDNWLALAGGREIWGFPKALGDIQNGPGPLQDAPIVVSSLVIPVFGSQAKASMRQVFELTPPSGTPAALPDPAAGLLDQLGQVLAGTVAGTEALLDLVHKTLSVGAAVFVTLKQIRQSSSETTTVYSSVITTRSEITALRGFGVLGGGYQLTLADFDSQPIARDLGLVAGAQSSIAGVWADVDFVLDLSS